MLPLLSLKARVAGSGQRVNGLAMMEMEVKIVKQCQVPGFTSRQCYDCTLENFAYETVDSTLIIIELYFFFSQSCIIGDFSSHISLCTLLRLLGYKTLLSRIIDTSVLEHKNKKQ